MGAELETFTVTDQQSELEQPMNKEMTAGLNTLQLLWVQLYIYHSSSLLYHSLHTTSVY